MQAPVTPQDDPLPWVTEQMSRAGVFDTSDAQPMRTSTTMPALTEVLTRMVSALHDDVPYRVVLDAATATAGTDMRDKRVQVGTRPMADASLTEGQRAAVMAGLALHEVGHIRYARDYRAALDKYLDYPVTALVSLVSNLAADLHDERKVCGLFPGLAHAVEVTMWWVSRDMPSDDYDLSTLNGRANAAIGVTRYPWLGGVATLPDEWVAWWQDWAERAQDAGTPKRHAAMVDEAMVKLRDIPQDDDDGDDDDDDGDPTDGDGQPGTDDSDPTDGDDDSDDDGAEPSDSTDGDDDSASESGDDGEDGSDTDDDSDDAQDGSEGDDSDDDGATDSTDDSDGGDSTDGEPTDDEGDDESSEDMDDLPDICPSAAARDTDFDTAAQNVINATLRAQRLSARRRRYDHSTSKYHLSGGRTVAIARRVGRGFTI